MCKKFILVLGVLVLALMVGTAQAALTHRYSFTTDTADSVGGAHASLVDGYIAGTPSISGGQVDLGNPGFTGPSSQGNYVLVPTNILPSSGSVTIEQWFTFGGSGFWTEAWAFSDEAGGNNPPGENNGQYLMHTISNPQGGPNAGPSGGSSIAQATTGYAGDETRAYMTTPGIGAGGGGYLDDGGTYFAATVIDADANTLSYYVYRVSDGLGGLQDTIPAISLSSYSFTNAYLGRSPFGVDNVTSGVVDEFRIFDNALSASMILTHFELGPDVPEPATVILLGLGSLALLRRRKS